MKDFKNNYEIAVSECSSFYSSYSKRMSETSRYIAFSIIGTIWTLLLSKYNIIDYKCLIWAFVFSIVSLILDFIQYSIGAYCYGKNIDELLKSETETYLKKHREKMNKVTSRIKIFFGLKVTVIIIAFILFSIGIYNFVYLTLL